MVEPTTLVKAEPKAVRRTLPVLEQERCIMTLGAENHWPFRVIGAAPVPEEPVYLGNWWLVPAEQDHSVIPTRALARVQAIYAAGARPKGFVIAHEAPKELAAPAGSPHPSRWEYWGKEAAKHSATALKSTGTVLKVTGVALAVVAVPLIAAGAGLALLIASGIASAAMIDPCLIAVTEDEVWIVLDSWMTGGDQ